jgi:hypothetical protein
MQLLIREFRTLINALPYFNHSFQIKRDNWKVESQQRLIDDVFGDEDAITLNRYDLLKSAHYDLKSFIVKTLMWGYPTKGRGNNINRLLEVDNFKMLVSILNRYQKENITVKELFHDINSIPGLGLSTMSKFMYFFNIWLNDSKALILDNRIIEVINKGNYSELNHLKGIRYDNAITKYPLYIETIDKLADSMDVEPDQIEMFLFTFGNNLSRVNGENVYDFD